MAAGCRDAELGRVGVSTGRAAGPGQHHGQKPWARGSDLMFSGSAPCLLQAWVSEPSYGSAEPSGRGHRGPG